MKCGIRVLYRLLFIREFESIVNFLSRAEVLPAWNSSAPFRIRMEDIDEALLATAYEKVSGGKIKPS